MTGMQMMLSALGIKIPEQDLVQLEKLLPQLPKYCIDATNTINAAFQSAQRTEQRLAAIEKLLEEIRDGNTNTGKRAANGATNSGGHRTHNRAG